ncbi:hypothetical protein HPB51_020472 [Rhipicephalus microplus]|uniref:Uncharacterized protein n=1 Tax=Rhipicephalus microplus TaxID=6941 RepID=A0A9J6DBZ1_RHIMP|nr:hypothetical protein HPB51_020472 [Rhipicephalus microplus]
MPGQTTQSLHGSAPAAGTPCCESGRPVLTDPITGQTVCSCQYDAQLLNYQRLAGLPINMYGTAAAYAGDQGFLPLGAAEQSAFYSPSSCLISGRSELLAKNISVGSIISASVAHAVCALLSADRAHREAPRAVMCVIV